VRIVQVCPYSWSARGGVQTHVRHLARHLTQRGHDVRVLAAGPLDGASCGRTTDIDVELIGASIRVPFNGSIAPICLQARAIREVRRALDAFRPDIVHVHEPFVPAVSLAAVRWAPAPVVATFHAHCPPSLDGCLYSLAAQCLKSTVKRMAVRVGVSRAAAISAAVRLGDTVRVVPNGVDVETLAAANPARFGAGRTILFVGRLDRRKGFDVAVRAFARLCDRYEDLLFVVAGTGPCRGDADAVSPAVRRRIVMLGEVDDERLPSVYAAADVFVAPAVGCESFGLVLLEAMAAGAPIVASAIDGYREVVRADVDALLVRPRDEDALAGAISRVLDSPELAGRLACAARARARQFAWSVVVNTLERAYRSAARANATDAAIVNVRFPPAAAAVSARAYLPPDRSSDAPAR
jgi:phosphatidyl-myo-inositol alpha-mannosyltransferase